MFCIKCGGKTEFVSIEGDELKRDRCRACGYIHYHNPKIIAGILPIKNFDILLCKRDIEPGFGKWTIPAGFLEMGETLEDGAKREAKEEANLEIKLMKLYGTYSIPRISQIYIIYLGKILNDDYFGNSETSEVRMFKVKDIPWSDIAFSSVKFLLEKYKYDLNNKGQFGFYSNS